VVKIPEIILALKTTKIILVFCIAIVWHTSHANSNVIKNSAQSSENFADRVPVSSMLLEVGEGSI
jgi:hypothetical protein